MSIVTFKFLIFLFASVILYYLLPKKYRWIELLITSAAFIILTVGFKLFFTLVSAVAITYIFTFLMEKFPKHKKKFLILSILMLIGMLGLFKYINFIPLTFNTFGRIFKINLNFKFINLVAPLGISYYTLSLISYIFDCYYSTIKREKNFFKVLLFGSYYLVLISGPITRYNEVKDELFNTNKLEYKNIYQGFYRVIYGLMKKLVIADALAVIVTTIFSNYKTYTGFYLIFGVILYAIQIYNDFSGCMDIVIGASKMYGVKLPENFDSPYFSKNLGEFWRRWHISLGRFFKDYVMYPLLKSALFIKINDSFKSKFGKKLGKKLTVLLATLILWTLIGIWHGVSFKYIVASGLLPWIFFAGAELGSNLPEKINKKLHIKTECFSFDLFRMIRTTSFLLVVWFVVCSPSLRELKSVIRHLFIFSDIDLLLRLPKFSVSYMLLIVLLVDYLNYKGINVFEKFEKQNLIFRWIVIFFFITIILLYGHYGPNYNAANFIYGGF